MGRKKSAKRKFIMSILSLIFTAAMFIGTTFAWFSDSVTSGKNEIEAGNLDVDLVMDKAGDGKYTSIGGTEATIFGKEGSLAAQNDSTDTLWEPGKTQIVYLGVCNVGTLALKYNMVLNVVDEGLVGALEYALIDGAKASDLTSVTDWETLKSVATKTGDVTAGEIKAAENGVLDEIINGTELETDYFAFAVHMKEDAGSEYMNKYITVDVTVNAAQVTAEEDSFDNTYDMEAK